MVVVWTKYYIYRKLFVYFLNLHTFPNFVNCRAKTMWVEYTLKTSLSIANYYVWWPMGLADNQFCSLLKWLVTSLPILWDRVPRLQTQKDKAYSKVTISYIPKATREIQQKNSCCHLWHLTHCCQMHIRTPEALHHSTRTFFSTRANLDFLYLVYGIRFQMINAEEG